MYGAKNLDLDLRLLALIVRGFPSFLPPFSFTYHRLESISYMGTGDIMPQIFASIRGGCVIGHRESTGSTNAQIHQLTPQVNQAESSAQGASHHPLSHANYSAASRNSASEASRTIGTEGRKKGEPVVLKQTGKEGRPEGILKNVRVQSTLSRLSATTGSAIPTQHTSSRLTTQPLSNSLIPNRSIPSNPQVSRLTLPPKRHDDPASRSDIQRNQPERVSDKNVDPQAIDIHAILETTKKPAKPFVPKQKIKQLYAQDSPSKSGKQKGKAVTGPPPPTLRLQKPEEGNWDGGGHDWVEKSVSPVEPTETRIEDQADLAEILTRPAEIRPTAKGKFQVEIPAETTKPPTPRSVHRQPTSVKRAELPKHRARTVSITGCPPVQANTDLPSRSSRPQESLFLPHPDDDNDHGGAEVVLPRGNQGNPPRNESPEPDPVLRSKSRREIRCEVSPDTQEVVESQPPRSDIPRTSPTQVSRSRPSDRNDRTSRSISTSHHSHRNLEKDDDFNFGQADEQPQVDQSSSRTRSGPSPVKTYGAKTRSMIPPPLSKRSKKDEKRVRKDRDSRSRARVRDGDNIQDLARGVRIGSSARPDIQLPVSDIRDSNNPSTSRRLGTYHEFYDHVDDDHFDNQPEPNRSRRHSEEIIPDSQVDIPDQEQSTPEDDMDLNNVSHPRQIRPEDVNSAGADILAPNENQEEEGEDEMEEDEGEQEEEEEGEWTRKIPWDLSSHRTRQSDKTRRSQDRRRKSRRGSPSYHYLAHKIPLTPIDGIAQGDPRRNAKRKLLEEDYADMREEDERKRRKKNRHREEKRFWEDTSILRAPRRIFYEQDVNENPRLRPLSKHGDPAIKDRERQMAENGLYVARGKAVDRTGHVWAHDNRSRRDRASMLTPRLKMSRGKTSETRAKTEKYVSIISEHSRSSRGIRRPAGRCAASRIDDIPGYLVKPINTVSWEDYNATYDETRAFPIDSQLIRRTMADLRARALRPGQGRNRLRNTKTGVRRDAEIRRRDSRILGMEDSEDRIEINTPTQHSTDLDSGNYRPIPRRAPKLNFTTRSPTPPAQTRPQKRKISTLLQSAEKGEEEVTNEADNPGEWENEVRPDPIIPSDFFDNESQVPQVRQGDRTRKLSTSTISGTGNPAPIPKSLNPIANRGLPSVQGGENDTSRETGQRITDPKRTWPPLSAKSVPLPHPPADEIDSDYPSVPTASELRSRPSRPSRPSEPQSRDSESTVGPTTTDSTTTSKMLSGTGLTEELMASILKTTEMFAQPPKEPPPTGGLRGGRPRLRQPRITEAVARQKESTASTIEKTADKGKGRDPRERPIILKLPSRISTDSSDTPVPGSRAYKARATQQSSSRIDFDSGENGVLPPSSAKVIVRPPGVSSPLAGNTGSAPRIGLQRTKTSAAPTQSLKTPLRSGKSMATLKSQFRTPTQSTPIRPLTTPRLPLGDSTQHYHPSSDAGDGQEHTLHIDAGQYMPSPTQANTIYTSRSRSTWGGKSIPSYARASITEVDSSSNPTPNASMATSGSGFNLSSSAHSRRMAPTQFADALYGDELPTPTKEKSVSTPSTSGKFAPAPTAILRGKSLIAGFPKSSALKKTTRMDAGQLGIAGPSNAGGRGMSPSGRKIIQRGGEGIDRSGSGVDMERIRSQRAKQPFRAPSGVPQDKDIGDGQGEWI